MIREPTLFVFIFMPRTLQRDAEDRRADVLNQICRIALHSGLSRITEGWEKFLIEPGECATKIIAALHQHDARRHDDDYFRLVNWLKERPGPPAGSAEGQSLKYLYQCLIYAYMDVLVVQIVLFDPGSGALASGLNTLLRDLHGRFDPGVLRAAHARREVLGVSAVYWGVAHGDANPFTCREEYAEEIQHLFGGQLRCTQTDVGPLWRAEAKDVPREVRVFGEDPGLFEDQELFLDQWVLVTPGLAEAQVNQRFNQPRVDGPADFVRVAIARHKFAFERTEYDLAHDELEKTRHDLGRQTRQIIATQAHPSGGLGELRGHASLEFQSNLSRKATSLADYRQGISQVRELYRTLRVNLRNFLVHCPLLIEATALAEIDASEDRKQEASRILARQDDEIFKSEIAQMRTVCGQLETYLDYAQQVMEGHAAALQSGMDRLRIASERTIGEMSGLHAVEAAAVVASVAAILAIEVLKAPSGEEPHGLAAILPLLLVVAGSFFLMRLLSLYGQVKHRWDNPWTRLSFIATVTSLVALGVWGFHLALRWNVAHLPPRWSEMLQGLSTLVRSLWMGLWTWARSDWKWMSLMAVVVGVGVYFIVSYGFEYGFEIWTYSRRKAQRLRRDKILKVIKKRLGAAEALVDLVTDIPLTPKVFPLDKKSLRFLYVVSFPLIAEFEERFGDLPLAKPYWKYGARFIDISTEDSNVTAQVQLRPHLVHWLVKYFDPPEMR